MSWWRYMGFLIAETTGFYAWNRWFLRWKPSVSSVGTSGNRRSSQWKLPLGRLKNVETCTKLAENEYLCTLKAREALRAKRQKRKKDENNQVQLYNRYSDGCRAGGVRSMWRKRDYFLPKSAGTSPHFWVSHLMMGLRKLCVRSQFSARCIIW